MATCELERPAFADFYAVAGRFICVESRDAAWASAFGEYFAGWHVEAVARGAGASPRGADARIVVRRGDERPPSPPASFESFEVAGGGVCRTDGRTYFIETDGSLIRVSAESPTAVEVWTGGGGASREGAAAARLIFNASMTAMRRCGLFELHAAGVVEPESGAGVLFVGPSGSGKSTTTTQLASAGWRYLSDDTLLLTDSGEQVETLALRRVFAVTAPTAASQALAGREEFLTMPVPFDPHKVRFEPQSVFPGGFQHSCAPRAVFFPTVTREGESAARRLSQAEAMALLIRVCPWAGYDRPAARAHLGALAKLARQAAAFELRAGTDLLGDASRASDFIKASIGGAAR